MALCKTALTFRSTLSRQLLGSKHTYSVCINGVPKHARRTFLSDAYKGTSAWRTRRLLAVNMDELKIMLDANFFDLKKPVSSIDLHKFIDNVSDEHQLQSAEQYLYCHRHSPMTNHLRASTVHCYIRTCIDLGMSDKALKVLKDKTNYGLFPDNFTNNLLLGDYLQREDVRGAATVAMEMMRLEILTNDEHLSQLLSLYACHQYLKSGQNTQEETHDLGMTFADATRGQTSLLSRSYHIIGLSMAGRYKEVAQVLQSVADGNKEPCVVNEVIERLQGEMENPTEGNQETISNIQDLLTRLQAEDKILAESLDSLIISETLPLIKEVEKNHSHLKMYPLMLEEWHKEHIEAVKNQIKAAQDHERSIKEQKLEKLLEAVGGIKYWTEKEERRRQEEAKEEERIRELETGDLQTQAEKH
ncbi:small ribosomal subunit protein mS27-like [Asterias amurensis]|uniref:small ribosomal subunit protein mS27-like n=1 Tax=Asterias amurensis TaxID=7602 RepID=UPI003AB15415